MSDQIEQLADTLTVEFTAAVKAANRARAAQVDAIIGAKHAADEARRKGLAEVRRMQEEAARMAADSLRLAERVEAKHREAEDAILAMIAELRGTPAIAGRTAPMLPPGMLEN